MNLTRDPLLAALRRAVDPRGLQPHELAVELMTPGAEPDPKIKHRLRALLAELLAENMVEKAEGGRYRIVGWRPAAPPPSVAAAAPRTPTRRSGPGSTPATTPRGLGYNAGTGSVPVAAHGVAGKIRVHPAGYGFVVRDDGENDVFVAARNRGGALDGDRVALDTWMGFKGTEGRVADVLERGRARITGILHDAGRTRYLEADDPRIPGHVSLDGDTRGARDGQCVVAEITEYPSEPEGPLRARIVHLLGDADDPRTEVAKTIACAEIPDEFPADVLAEARRVPETLVAEDMVDRTDLRERQFLTIDPETARDFDDAVCVEDGPRPGLERLWVAVADVSHYVRPGSALDAEAQLRGVSVYLPNRAISMLPHELSAGICSLNPDVDRCAMVVRMDIDATGHIVDQAYMAAVIRSKGRLDYAGVAAALAGDLRGPRAKYEPHLPHLRRMQTLSHKLRALRTARGSLDFDLPEAQVILDADDPRLVRDVKKSRSLPEVKEAYRIVEDFMLAANESVARFFASHELPTLWRVHEPPTLERLGEFAALAESFGIPFNVEDGRTPRKMRDFLGRIAGKPMERSLSYLLLRALKQAIYDVVNLGHFGLAAPEYLHFTSPIRRYPDLIVHRLLKAQLRAEGLPAAGGMHGPMPSTEELVRMAGDSSSFERRAMECEREVVDMYRAFLMRDKVGQQYEGTVVGVTSFGIFVEIPEPFVEGLVKTERLGGGAATSDRYVFDARSVRLVSPVTGVSFALGDKVTVEIENVSVQRRKIDMALIDHVSQSPPVALEHRPRERAGGPGRPGARGARPSQPARSSGRPARGGSDGSSPGKSGKPGKPGEGGDRGGPGGRKGRTPERRRRK